VIIGGGVMGCSIAYNLAAKGMTGIVLLERDVLGAGATGRSTATVHTHFSTSVLTKLAQQSLAIFRSFDDLVGGTCGFTGTGHLVFAGGEHHVQTNASIALHHEAGIETRLVSHQDASELARGFQLRDCAAIVYEPLSGYADASGTTLAYASRARQLGVKTELRTTATGLELTRGRITGVETGKGTIKAERVILAAGAWSRDFLLPYGVKLPLQVTRHEVAAFQKPSTDLGNIPVISDLINQTHFRPEGEDLILAGTAEPQQSDKSLTDPAFYGQRPTQEFTEAVWPRLVNRVPMMETAKYTNGFAGLYTSTPDRHPIIDRLRIHSGLEGLFLCAGFSGHGFKLAPAVGVAMAELVLHEDSPSQDISDLGISRFQDSSKKEQTLTFSSEADVII